MLEFRLVDLGMSEVNVREEDCTIRTMLVDG